MKEEKRIFLIDDDQLFNLSFIKQMEKRNTYKMYSYDSLADAIDHVDLEPEVIILDHNLRGSKGVEIIPYFRERLPKCEIIYISGQLNIETLAKARQVGASHYFKKDETLVENVYESIENRQHVKFNTTSSILNKLKSFKLKKRKTSIFIVDDDELYSVFLKYKLSKKGNFDIAIYLDANKILDETAKKPNILVLDYNLVKMTGETIINKFKQKSPSTKIIMLSSQTNLEVALRLFKLGIDDYVVKNKNWEENLIYAIQKHSMSALD